MKAIILPAGRPDTCQPLTSTRELGEVPVANRPFRDRQIAELSAAGHEIIDEPVDEPVLRIAGNAWIDAADLTDEIGELKDANGNLLASTNDAARTSRVASAASFAIVYPWDFLKVNEMLLDRLSESDFDGPVHNDGVLVVGEGTRLMPGVYVEGKVIIGRNCKIGPNCYFRGPVSVGDGCHIGQAVEVKASLLMDGVSAGHLSYIGDSIIGTRTNFGAGTITANFRHDGKNHRSMVGNELIDTGRRKFGAIVGDDVHTGIHTSIYPGRKLWPHTSTRPGDVVQRDLIA